MHCYLKDDRNKCFFSNKVNKPLFNTFMFWTMYIKWISLQRSSSNIFCFFYLLLYSYLFEWIKYLQYYFSLNSFICINKNESDRFNLFWITELLFYKWSFGKTKYNTHWIFMSRTDLLVLSFVTFLKLLVWG